MCYARKPFASGTARGGQERSAGNRPYPDRKSVPRFAVTSTAQSTGVERPALFKNAAIVLFASSVAKSTQPSPLKSATASPKDDVLRLYVSVFPHPPLPRLYMTLTTEVVTPTKSICPS